MPVDSVAIERRSLQISKWGNLFMALAGVAAAYYSHSLALLVDGLYSGVNFGAALIAARVATLVNRPPDTRYPWGYDALESLYVTFRSLVILGILALAVVLAGTKIVDYLSGEDVKALVFGPIIVYTVVVVTICFTLSWWQHYNWKRTGSKSEILKTESHAAFIDGMISAGAGGALILVSFLKGTPLDVIVPIADSLVVLILAACIIHEPIGILRNAIKELAGEKAQSPKAKRIHQLAEEILLEEKHEIFDIAINKLGRRHLVIAAINKEGAMTAAQLDAVRQRLSDAMREGDHDCIVEIILTAQAPYTEPPEDD